MLTCVATLRMFFSFFQFDNNTKSSSVLQFFNLM
jgi:hypothetical protein